MAIAASALSEPGPRAGRLGRPGENLRDALTCERLINAVLHLPGLQVVEFVPQWWDGQAYTACLVVRGGRRWRLLRVVETGGECVVVPYSRRVAARWLAARRRPRAAQLGIPRQRTPADIVLDASADVVRCPNRSCGVLVPLGYDGDCPVCT